MTDFISAYEQGIKAAKVAEKNKMEIQSVFAEMNAQLSKATAKKLTIKVETKYYEDFSNLAHNTLEYFLNREGYKAITATINANSRELAKWEINQNGYPCTIIIDGEKIYCEDQKGLENGLKELLSHPATGEKLSELFKMAYKQDLVEKLAKEELENEAVANLSEQKESGEESHP